VAELIARIPPDKATSPTPCPSWDVGALVNHVYSDIPKFTTGARGERPDWSRPEEHIGNDWVADFRAAAAALLAAWRAADPQKLVPMPGGGEQPLLNLADNQTAEFAVHAWDIARATGQSTDLDPDVGYRALTYGRQNLRPEFRGGTGSTFGQEVPVPDDAPIYDRLAGWFGRNPDWCA